MAEKVPSRPREYLTRAQAAELLGVSVRTIGRMLAEGSLPHVKLRATNQGRVRIATAALDEFLRERAA